MFDEQVQHRCNDCGTLSPPVNEGDTFLSSSFGWRLHRYQDERGEIRFEWRCPTCWSKFKAAKASPAEPPTSSARGGVAPDSRPRSSGSYSHVAERTKSDKGR